MGLSSLLFIVSNKGAISFFVGSDSIITARSKSDFSVALFLA